MNNENKYQFINNLPKEYQRILWDIMIKAESDKYVSACEKLTKQECKLIMRYLYKKDKELQKANDTIKELRDKNALDLVKISINSQYINTQNENIRLNNIINELEAWIKCADEHYPEAIPFRETLRKLKELKESGNNEN